jgi:hypothetical protein
MQEASHNDRLFLYRTGHGMQEADGCDAEITKVEANGATEASHDLAAVVPARPVELVSDRIPVMNPDASR